MFSNICVLGLKAEAAQNTAASLAETDFVYARNVKVTPIPEFIPQDVRMGTLDQIAAVLGTFWVELSFTLDIRTSGAAGTAFAPLSAALQGAGMSETISAGASVTYAFTSVEVTNFFTLGKSFTAEVYKGSAKASSALKHQLKGCVCTSGDIKFIAGKTGQANFKALGLYVAIADATLPTCTYLTGVPKILENSTISFHGATPVLKSLEIDFGIEHAVRDDASMPYGVGGFAITGRKPKGKITIEAVTVATKNYLLSLLAGTEASTSLTLGAGAGYINTFTMAKTQLMKKDYNDDNIMKFDFDLQFNKNTGDDSVVFAQT